MKPIVKSLLLASLFVSMPSLHSADAPAPAAVAPAPAPTEHKAVPPDMALFQLMGGNARFVAGKTTHPHQDEARRKELAGGQYPLAIVLTCADSRVSPEVIFDQGLGDIFVLRNAGNVVDDHILGSIEYAVEHLHARLIVVLGHESCGAVKATVDGGEAPGHIGSIVEWIKPGLQNAATQPGDKLDNAVRANVIHSVNKIKLAGSTLTKAIQSGEVKVVPGRYDLDTGKVEVLK